ncbi:MULTISPECIES: Ig-like domain-containing protein [unclassified Rhizobium]|uniref:Ig-like domain-containing protein n=1 Tax=unclassified Rhizobium TaxID=2613769 RepID=UPI001607E514|nr:MULTISPECIES: Ig-like domain-containing protein [unclassified Rhizobium]MBB3288557.1 hypothetical protein [Rhizobium sp. BK252]MBB3403306.1 hypothetical protein [Rhizobium sp. BK289]MBB3415881.1 hypothetical protein [Rhizobium sp. BK284]MBB3483769.1 hypothetical protein [Rhizobium sp. BK347]MDK4722252.1 hypothetical protein [Rhizobium sp. CNPSo 3968]
MKTISLISLGLSLSAAIALSGCVSAPIGGAKQTETKGSIRAGKRTQVMSVSFLKPDCTFSSYPYTAIVKPSSHGKVEITHGSVKAHFPSDEPMHMCNGKSAEGTIVYYTPDAGFAGADQFTIRMTGLNAANGVAEHTLKIHVVK